ncbi:DUF5947 family protein [Aciditerrimonas ferrireducens]|jgi:hypothetical protein|uniref:DUF5947 family protein n=1 Tax=Aciditerrimonas ferrireducens TaxID=667306 RepID=A0ABV6C6G7_9ACTN
MTGATDAGFAALRRLRARGGADGERCELCGEALEAAHGHLLEVPERQVRCCCRACQLLFEHPGAAAGRLRAIPGEVVPLAEPVAGDWWARLGLPVGVVFVVVDDAGQPSAAFPGAAGAAWAELEGASWRALGDAHPEAQRLLPEVQALFVSHPGRGWPPSGPGEGWVVPIDACYELVGALRQSWRGFDGGPAAQAVVARFCERLAGAVAKHTTVSGSRR